MLETPEVSKKFAAEGGGAVGGTPEEFAALLKADHAKWGKIVKDSGATVD